MSSSPALVRQDNLLEQTWHILTLTGSLVITLGVYSLCTRHSPLSPVVRTTVFYRYSVVAQTTSPLMCSDSNCIHRRVLVGTSMGHSLIPIDTCQRNAMAGLRSFSKAAVLSCSHYLLHMRDVYQTEAPLLLLAWNNQCCNSINSQLDESHSPWRQWEHKVSLQGLIQLQLMHFYWLQPRPIKIGWERLDGLL